MVGVLSHVDETLASRVAEGLGIGVTKKLDAPLNMSIPADGKVRDYQPKPPEKPVGTSPALSMANTVKDTIKTRKVAILAADGVDDAALSGMKQALAAAGAQAKIVAPRLGHLTSAKGKEVKIDFSLLITSSVLFDAVYIPGGEKSVAALKGEADALHFVNEAYKHCKTIAATGAGVELLRASYLGAHKIIGGNGKGNQIVSDEGVIISRDAPVAKVAADFINAIAQHRH